MANPVRAKFYCGEKAEVGYLPEPANKTTKVILYPVLGESEENKAYWKYTPSGKLEMQMINKEAADVFEVGKEYYIDFTPAN
jgi:hypothetical protein